MHLFVCVVPNYVKFVTFSNNLLPNFMRNFVLDSVDKTQTRKYLLLSALTLYGLSYEPITKFLCSSLHKFRLRSINNHRQFRVEAEVTCNLYWLPLTPPCEIRKRSWKIIITKHLISNNPEEKTHQTTLYNYFWIIPRRLSFKCRRFGTLCSIFTFKTRRSLKTRTHQTTLIHTYM